jgi:hypothetical protein
MVRPALRPPLGGIRPWSTCGASAGPLVCILDLAAVAVMRCRRWERDYPRLPVRPRPSTDRLRFDLFAAGRHFRAVTVVGEAALSLGPSSQRARASHIPGPRLCMKVRWSRCPTSRKTLPAGCCTPSTTTFSAPCTSAMADHTCCATSSGRWLPSPSFVGRLEGRRPGSPPASISCTGTGSARGRAAATRRLRRWEARIGAARVRSPIPPAISGKWLEVRGDPPGRPLDHPQDTPPPQVVRTNTLRHPGSRMTRSVRSLSSTGV